MISMPVEGDGASLVIEVHAYEMVDGATAPSDANWLEATIRISCGALGGVFNASLTTQDFALFAQELSQLLRDLKGKAAFQTDEEHIQFDVEMTGLGRAVVTGVAKSIGQAKSSLTFSFQTDQTYLTRTMSSLAQVVDQFPVQPAKKHK